MRKNAARRHHVAPIDPRKSVITKRGHDQPWVPKNALVGRSRRSSHQ